MTRTAPESDSPSEASAAAADLCAALSGSLSGVRWIALAAMLTITLIWPLPGRAGHPLWLYVSAFAIYNTGVEVARARVPRLRSFAWVPYLDLPVAGLLYFLDAEPGGPLFVAFYLAVITAAVTMTLRGTLLYAGAVVLVVAGVAPTLPLWSATPPQLRTLSARLVVLALVGAGTAVLTGRLVREHASARADREAAARLAELDRLRTGFFSAVSHELRTPLTAARAGLGMATASLEDRLRPDERQVLAIVQRNVERLRVLIDDLLTYNQLEAGVLRLEPRPTDLRKVVADAAATVQPLLRQKGQTLTVELEAPLPVRGDDRRLEQVLVNLLANAYDHTPTGTRITISGETGPGGADGAGGAEVHLRVRDDGPGIPPAALEDVFERFYRAGTSGGSGLGLAIARALVELHGGRIWAENAPGSGAVFHVVLPAADAE